MPQDLNELFQYGYYRPPKSRPYWAKGEQQQREDTGGASKFWLSAAGLYGAAFVPVGDQRIGDYYYRTARFLEEASPGKILRTFGLSQLLSPLSTIKNFTIDPSVFTNAEGKANRAAREYFGAILGQTVQDLENKKIFETGLEFRRTGQLFGQLYIPGTETQIGGKVLPINMGLVKGNAFADWYARVLGVKLGFGKSVVGEAEQFATVLGAKRHARLLGIPFPGQAVEPFEGLAIGTNMLRAHAASQIGRMVKLLRAPGDYVPWVGELVEKAGLHGLKIPPGTATQMLGRIAGLGMAVGGLATFASYLSDERRSSDRATSTLMLGTVGALGGLAYGKTSKAALIGAGIGSILGLAPVFDEGIFQGFGTMWTKLMRGGAKISEATGATEAAKEQEALAPGITQVSTMIGFTLSGALVGGMFGYAGKMAAYTKSGIATTDKYIEELTKQITTKQQQIIEKGGWINRVKGEIAGGLGLGLESAPLSWQGIKDRMLVRGGRFGALFGLGAFGVLAAGATILSGNLIPGIFAAEHTPEELDAIYSGQQEVEIRRGRWWEMGRSPFEGNKISYYRQHWYPLLMADARTKGLYGSAKERWEQSSLLHPIESIFSDEFKYRWEEQNIQERPYPVSAPWGYDIPVVGPLIASTIGKLIKPPRLYRVNEWMQGNEVLQVPTDTRIEPGLETGEGPGAPVSPYTFRRGMSETISRLNELRGLPGFVHQAIKEKITGSQYYMEDYQELATPQRALGNERAWYERELGGLASLSEPIRRFIARERRRDYYDPLLNNMPCLLPETEVLMSTGICCRADEIKIGDKLISKDGKEVDVENIGKFPCNKIVEVVVYGDNLHSLRFSPNHPIYMNNHQFKNAIDLKANDYVAFPRRLYSESKDNNQFIDMIEFLNDNYSFTDKYIYYGVQKTTSIENEIAEKYLYEIRDIPINIKKQYPKIYNICAYKKRTKFADRHTRFIRYWDIDDLYFLLGVYLAEGSQGNKNKTIKLSGHINDKWEQRIIEIFNKYEIKYSFQKNKEKGQNICVTNPTLLQILMALCPGHAYEKKIVPTVLERSRPISAIKSLLRGLIDGDGYFIHTKDNRIKLGLRTVSKDLAYQFRNLLIDCIGIVPAIIKGFYKNKFSIHVIASGSSANQVANFIGYKVFDYKPKQNNNKQYSDDTHVYIKVKKVSIKQEECFVIGHQVSGDHTFCVSTIATHNTWIPGSYTEDDQFYIDFHRGDPFTRIPEGELRLPGSAYAALHPELAGVAPEDYPLVHRYKILADVAQYSNEFKRTRHELSLAIKRKELSSSELAMVEQVQAQLEAKREKRKVSQYLYADDTLEEMIVRVKEHLENGLIRTDRGIIGVGDVIPAGEKGTNDYRRKQAQMADFLREQIGPGTELNVFVHRDTQNRFATKTTGTPYMPASIFANETNIGQLMVNEGIAQFKEEDVLAARSQYTGAQRTFGRLWENITHFEPWTETLTPMAPMAKFVHQRTPLEDYERSRIWGRDIALWEKPWEHFIKPTIESFTSGREAIPEDVVKRWEIEQYFDRLKWIKFHALEQAAIDANDQRSATEFRAQQRYTMFGANPFGNPTNIIRAMPGPERDYFSAFAELEGEEERQRLLGILPEDYQRIYEGLWAAREEKAIKAQRVMGIADSNANQMMNRIGMLRVTEGQEINPQLYREYQKEASGTSYAEWARQKEAKEYFTENPLPGPNWIGWSPGVSLDDMKLKVVENAGLDYHDFGMWENQKRSLLRKPYIKDDPFEEELVNPHPSIISGSIKRTMMELYGARNVNVRVLPDRGDRAIEVNVRDNRKKVFKRYQKNDDFQEMM